MYTRSLGIQRDENSPGFKHFILQPTPDPSGKITFAKGFVETMYGKIGSEWKKEGNKVTYHFQIPANTRANVRILAPAGAQIKEGGKVVKASVTPTGLQTELGSGTYHWVVE
jgi:alpha-L-rhamnosidase